MSAPTQPLEESTFRLMYRSHNRIPAQDRKAALGELFTQARSNNKKRGLTGALLLSDDWFVQALEGDEATVRALFARIGVDPRHDSVTLLDARVVPGRAFSHWAMARVSAEDASDIPLIANQQGITPAAGRPTTHEQDQLLDVMRDAVRQVPHTM
jgi:Sensors of blue-light using FAD